MRSWWVPGDRPCSCLPASLIPTLHGPSRGEGLPPPLPSAGTPRFPLAQHHMGAERTVHVWSLQGRVGSNSGTPDICTRQYKAAREEPQGHPYCPAGETEVRKGKHLAKGNPAPTTEQLLPSGGTSLLHRGRGQHTHGGSSHSRPESF